MKEEQMKEDTTPKTLDPTTGLPLYKALFPGGKAVHHHREGFQWKLATRKPDGTWEPGEWMEVKPPLIWCGNGFHVTPVPQQWMTAGATEVWCIEWSGALVGRSDGTDSDVLEPTRDRDKVAVQRVRITRKATQEEIDAAGIAYAKWCEAKLEETRPAREALAAEQQKKREKEREAAELARKKKQAKELVERLKKGADAAKKELEQRKKAGLPSTGFMAIVQSIALLGRQLSDRDMGYACHDAAEFAIKHLKFDLEDFEKLADKGRRPTVHPWLWMDDWIYRKAIEHGNKSAMLAYEAWKKVKPFISSGVRRGHYQEPSNRLYRGVDFQHNGQNFTVTSVRFEEGYVNAKLDDVWVPDPDQKGCHKQVPNPDQRVYKITREELLAETKGRNKAIREAEAANKSRRRR
jgi:hypothetical protein